MAAFVGVGAFLSTLLICGTIAALTMTVNWSASPVSVMFYRYLAETVTREYCHRLSIGSWRLMGVLLFLAYLTDLLHWRDELARFTALYFVLVLASLLAGFFFQTLEMPILPVLVSAILMCLAVRTLRKLVFSEANERRVIFGISAAFLSLAVLLFAAWSLWLVTVEGAEEFDAALTSELAFVRAWCPCLLGILLCSAALVAWMRASLTERIAEVEEGSLPLPPELQVTFVVLTTTALMAWVAASVSVESPFLSGLILKIAGVSFAATVLYIADWVGTRRAALLVERNQKLRQLRGLLLGDWLKALLLLPLLPSLPLLLLVDMLHQAVRRSCNPLRGPRQATSGNGCLTEEATWLLEELRTWEWSSVLTKVMFICLAHFGIEVGVNQGLVLFLAWFNEVLQPWSFLAATGLLFLVEILLFLLPPVAGIPLYMIGGIVIIPKVMDAGCGFWAGIAAGTAFCLLLKLLATGLEQKAIGKPFSSSVAVKKFIGVQTPFMKAVRLILSRPGLSAPKVAVLCGGPDWPTSVITGIMGLPLGEMLVGTIPVVVIIFPTIVSAGYKLEAANRSDPSLCETVAGISLLASTMLQGLASASAAYYAQAVMDEFHDEFARDGSSFQRDPQEREVLAALEEDARRASEWVSYTAWQVQPFPARLLLVTGAVFSSITEGVVINPERKAFRDFTITDKVSELPGGNPLAVILPPGWVAIAMTSVVLCCLALYRAWCWLRVHCSSRKRPRVRPASVEMVSGRQGGGRSRV